MQFLYPNSSFVFVKESHSNNLVVVGVVICSCLSCPNQRTRFLMFSFTAFRRRDQRGFDVRSKLNVVQVISDYLFAAVLYMLLVVGSTYNRWLLQLVAIAISSSTAIISSLLAAPGSSAAASSVAATSTTTTTVRPSASSIPLLLRAITVVLLLVVSASLGTTVLVVVVHAWIMIILLVSIESVVVASSSISSTTTSAVASSVVAILVKAAMPATSASTGRKSSSATSSTPLIIAVVVLAVVAAAVAALVIVVVVVRLVVIFVHSGTNNGSTGRTHSISYRRTAPPMESHVRRGRWLRCGLGVSLNLFFCPGRKRVAVVRPLQGRGIGPRGHAFVRLVCSHGRIVVPVTRFGLRGRRIAVANNIGGIPAIAPFALVLLLFGFVCCGRASVGVLSLGLLVRCFGLLGFVLEFHGKNVPTKVFVSSTEGIVVGLFAARQRRHALGNNDPLFGTLAVQNVLFAVVFNGVLRRVFRFLHLLLFDLVHLFHHTLDEHFRGLAQANVRDEVVGANTVHAGEGTTKTILGQSITNTSFTDGSPFGVPG
mmetsp:Transcript_118570/g.242302  ORF Transcript_118570/g.242302 Transcript_118570/m.242302 type:complete len:541 (-) Transcript_118570:1372-2994(-)